MNYLIQHSYYFLLHTLTQSAICVKEKYTVCSLGTLEAPTGLHYEFKIKARWRVDLRHVAPSRFVHDKTHIAHSNSTNTQFNLYFLLFIPSYLKQVTSFRVMTSIFEALTIRSVRECQKRNKGYLQIWYLYVLSTIQLLQVGRGGWSTDQHILTNSCVQVVNSSLNLPIYYCVGSSFKTALKKYFQLDQCHHCPPAEAGALEDGDKQRVEHKQFSVKVDIENRY